ncbi:MAG: hypothetical protein ACAH59_02060 [Pseudobdellovibrionaceae bacterium]
MNRLLCLLLALSSVLFLSCSTFQRFPSSTHGRHLILTLHGVRGTEASFGDFHRIIKAHLESVDPNYKVIPVNFTYPTGQTNYDPNNITPMINDRIVKELGGMPTASDKISVIGYSMGGQVMGHWYTNTLANKNTEAIAAATQNLIGLGSPYWGSKHASVALDIKKNLDGLVKLGQMSGNEVRSLEMMSESTVDLRKKMIDWQTDPALKAKFHPRILSLAGIYPCAGKENPKTPGCGKFKNLALKLANDDLMNTRFSGLIRRETDMVVTVPSARMDFFYYRDSDASAGTVTESQFQDISEMTSTQLQIAESLHAGDGKYLADMVIVDSSCMEASQCKHETYKYLFEALAGCNQPGNSCLPTYSNMIEKLFGSRTQVANNDQTVQDELHGFFLELRLRMPAHYKLEEKIDSSNVFKYIQFNFKDPKSMVKGWKLLSTASGRVVTDKPIEFQIGRGSEIGSRLVDVIKNDQGEIKEIRVAISGRFSPAPQYTLKTSESMKNFVQTIWMAPVLPFTVSFPGLRERKIESRVRPTTSTYVDLSLTQ